MSERNKHDNKFKIPLFPVVTCDKVHEPDELDNITWIITDIPLVYISYIYVSALDVKRHVYRGLKQ